MFLGFPTGFPVWSLVDNIIEDQDIKEDN